MTAVVIRPLAESAVLVELGAGLSAALNARALALAAAIRDALLPGVIDVVPAYTTVMVIFDPEMTDGDAVSARVRDMLASLVDDERAPVRTREIPVVYDGPDLDEVAARAGLSRDEVARRHAAGTYRVAVLGFSPGFGYLLGLPPELATPRRTTPRTRVPRGTVAIGGAQTGVYAQDTPGGWNMIGRTSVRMFDLGREEASFLQPGDAVRFVAVDALPAEPVGVPPLPFMIADRAHIEVVEAGGMTTVQDLGRPGLMAIGVTPGGALDRRAAVLANRLVGNAPSDAVLECTAVGPVVRFSVETVIAVTGADLAPEVDRQSIPLWEPVHVPAGATLRFTQAGRVGHGWRCMIAVAGGVGTEPVLGSRSTDTLGKIGGADGAPLRAGDVLPIAEMIGDLSRRMTRRLTAGVPRDDGRRPLRVVLGPQAEWFREEGISALLETPYSVSTRSDRMGLRLSGMAIERARRDDLLSEGIAAGAIQVPPDGQPIVLLPPRQTVGGYPKVATVIGADLDRLGQLAPGDVVRFTVVSAEEALHLTRAHRAGYDASAVTECAVHAVAGKHLRGTGDGWSAATVVGMLDVAEAAGLEEVVVRSPGHGLRLSRG